MKLNEIFQNNDCKIFKVINFHEPGEQENWLLEETSYQLIPESNEDLWDALFVVKAFLIENGSVIEECFVDVCIPERISEFAFRNKNNNFTIENIIEHNLQTIPAVASDQFGDYELYYCRENPEIGLEVLKKGLASSHLKNVIAEDLGYILRDENRIEEAIEMFKVSEAYGASSEYTYWELADLYVALNLKKEELEYREKFKNAKN
jgi:tetratricopeptide (TPR) repeat protein